MTTLFTLPPVEALLVEELEDGSPAALAGPRVGTRRVVVDGISWLLGGDIVVAIQGNPVPSRGFPAGAKEPPRGPGGADRLRPRRPAAPDGPCAPRAGRGMAQGGKCDTVALACGPAVLSPRRIRPWACSTKGFSG